MTKVRNGFVFLVFLALIGVAGAYAVQHGEVAQLFGGKGKKDHTLTFVVAWHIAVPTKVVYLEGALNGEFPQRDFNSNDGERRYDRPYVPGWEYSLHVTYDGNDPESHWYSCEILLDGQLAPGTQSYTKFTNRPGTAACYFKE